MLITYDNIMTWGKISTEGEQAAMGKLRFPSEMFSGFTVRGPRCNVANNVINLSKNDYKEVPHKFFKVSEWTREFFTKMNTVTMFEDFVPKFTKLSDSAQDFLAKLNSYGRCPQPEY